MRQGGGRSLDSGRSRSRDLCDFSVPQEITRGRPFRRRTCDEVGFIGEHRRNQLGCDQQRHGLQAKPARTSICVGIEYLGLSVGHIYDKEDYMRPFRFFLEDRCTDRKLSCKRKDREELHRDMLMVTASGQVLHSCNLTSEASSRCGKIH